ncbi:MAG: AAA family ATPase [Planctomycetes bacterium]|nr:AAA family ATPase [Planctomycetota bacterium]
MLKKIAVFNHKGGVSKTTTSFNLGWSLSKKGMKVILVDSDSQCNLTLIALGFAKYNDFYEQGNKNNIKDALDPAFKSQPKLIESVQCIELPKNPNLLILPGHLDFSENEVQLGVSLQLSSAFGSMKNLPGAFNYLIEKTAQSYKADFAIIDMNPSLSAINQDILLSSDFFFVPTSPDYFSEMAIKSLARIIPTWERWAKSARGAFCDATYPLPTTTPKFLGYTINDFNLSGGEAQRSFRTIMDNIAREVDTTLVPSLAKENMLLPQEKYESSYIKMTRNTNNIKYPSNYCLAEISNFNKLIAMSNQMSIPIYEIVLFNPRPGQQKTKNWFNFLFDRFSQRIIDLTI